MADDPAAAYDATDPVAENNIRRDQARKAKTDADVYRSILNTPHGRDWFYRQLARCHIYASAFAPGQPDVTAFGLGEENIGKQWMLGAIDAAPELYMKMLKEQKAEEARIENLRTEADRKAREDNDIAIKTQGFDLPPPAPQKPTQTK